MRKNKTRRHRPAIKHDLKARGERLPRLARRLSQRAAACTQEILTKLNLLGKTRPFCSWHRVRKYDPL